MSNKSVAIDHNKLQYIIDCLPVEELLCQLAEEASELAQAALKLRRCYDTINPTPIPKEDGLKNLYEEIADVWLDLKTLGLDECVDKYQEIMAQKTDRWAKRLNWGLTMTDREKLIIFLNDHTCLDEEDCKEECSACLADHLIANGVTVQRWIPVTERLPEKDGSYIVASVTGKVYTAHWYTEKKCSGGYIREATWSHPNITHWMPMPEGPREG